MEINYSGKAVAIECLLDYYFCYHGNGETCAWFKHGYNEPVNRTKFR